MDEKFRALTAVVEFNNNGKLIITTGGPLYGQRFFVIYDRVCVCRRVATPYMVRDATGHNKFHVENTFGQTRSIFEENGVVSYLLPLLVSAGIMHLARRSVKPPTNGG